MRNFINAIMTTVLANRQERSVVDGAGVDALSHALARIARRLSLASPIAGTTPKAPGMLAMKRYPSWAFCAAMPADSRQRRNVAGCGEASLRMSATTGWLAPLGAVGRS